MNEPVWFQQGRDRSDRFARALEHGEGEHADAEFSEELALVSALRAAGSETALDQRGKDRIFAAIMAEAPMAESGTRADDARDDAPAVSARRLPVLDKRRKHKASLLAAATAAGIIAFGALGIELARDALPGDFLYDVKRTTESIGLDLTFSEDGKALKYLEIASTRIEELAGLVERHQTGVVGVDELPVYRAVIVDLDGAAMAASRGITAYAPQSDGQDLRTLQSWASRNHARLAEIRPTIPQAVVNRLDLSIELLRQIDERAQALLQRMNCELITSGDTDQLGALPSDDTCEDQSRQQRIPVLPKASSQQNQSGAKGAESSAEPNRQEASRGAESTDSPAPTTAEAPADAGVPGVEVPELPEASAPPVERKTNEQTSTPLTLFPRLPVPGVG